MPIRVSMWKKHYVHQHIVYVMAAANAWTDPKLQQTLLTVIGHLTKLHKMKVNDILGHLVWRYAIDIEI